MLYKVAVITADVYASKQGAAYRIYVDDTLMTERTFIWPIDKTYVSEKIIIKASDEISHTVFAESVDPSATFTIKNVTVDQRPSENTFRI
jgi:hypothetical protein